VVIIDDDVHVPGAHATRNGLLDALRAAGVDARRTEAPSPVSHGPLVVAVFGDRLPGKGRAQLLDDTGARVHAAIEAAREARRDVIVCAMGDPRLVGALGLTVPTIHAWSGDTVMQQAAARALAKKR
jgi:beta-glucosidase